MGSVGNISAIQEMDEVPLAEKNVASDLDVMKSDILKELKRVFNKRVKAFF